MTAGRCCPSRSRRDLHPRRSWAKDQRSAVLQQRAAARGFTHSHARRWKIRGVGEELELTSKVACECLSVGSVVLVEGQALTSEWQRYLEKLHAAGGKGAGSGPDALNSHAWRPVR